jgi:hypothetical protein
LAVDHASGNGTRYAALYGLRRLVMQGCTKTPGKKSELAAIVNCGGLLRTQICNGKPHEKKDMWKRMWVGRTLIFYMARKLLI